MGVDYKAYCINDPGNRQLCILKDPNLCEWELFSPCAEANPTQARAFRLKERHGENGGGTLPLPEAKKVKKTRKRFYEDDPLDDEAKPKKCSRLFVIIRANVRSLTCDRDEKSQSSANLLLTDQYVFYLYPRLL